MERFARFSCPEILQDRLRFLPMSAVLPLSEILIRTVGALLRIRKKKKKELASYIYLNSHIIITIYCNIVVS